MLKKNSKIKLLAALLIVSLTLGCAHNDVSIKFEKGEMDISISKEYYTNSIEVKSRYEGAQKVMVTINADDPRIKFGKTGSQIENFQNKLIINEELGKNAPKNIRFSISTYKSNLPAGDYKIFAQIDGLESKGFVKTEMSVKVT